MDNDEASSQFDNDVFGSNFKIRSYSIIRWLKLDYLDAYSNDC